jgi:hypothetical protein
VQAFGCLHDVSRHARPAARPCVLLLSSLLALAGLYLLYAVLASITEYPTLTTANLAAEQTVADFFRHH